jgi:hypothetical protein
VAFKFDECFIPATIRKAAIEKAASARSFNESIKAAKKCLEHADFQRYKSEFENAYARILRDIIIFTEDHFDKGKSAESYAIKMSRYVQRIEDLMILLNRIELEASHEPIQEGKPK